MAQVRVGLEQASSGQLPPVCICCGEPAARMVFHKFYYRPTWLLIVRLFVGRLAWVLGTYRYVNLNVPVCNRHLSRLKLPTYLTYAVLAWLLLGIVASIACSAIGAGMENNQLGGLVALMFVLPLMLMLVGLFVLQFITPRADYFDYRIVSLTAISPRFAQALGQGEAGASGMQYGSPQPQYAASSAFKPYAGFADTSRPAPRQGGMSPVVLALIIVGVILVGLVFVAGAGMVGLAMLMTPRARPIANNPATPDFPGPHAFPNSFPNSAPEPPFRGPGPFGGPGAGPKAQENETGPTKTPNPTSPSGSTSFGSTPTGEAPSTLTPPGETPAVTSPPPASPESGEPTPPPVGGGDNEKSGEAALRARRIADLRSGNFFKVKEAAEELQNAVDAVPDEELTSLLVQLLSDKSVFVRGAAAGALKKWGTESCLTPLRTTLKNNRASVFEKRDVVAAIGEIERRLGLADEPGDPVPGSKQLKVGDKVFVQTPDGLLAGKIVQVRSKGVYRVTAGEEGVEQTGDFFTNQLRFAKKPAGAAAKPTTRGGEEGAAPSTTDKAPAKAEPTEPRVWTDASGKFAIVAEFVSLADGKVKLKKKADGEIVTLPLEKLSIADQEFVREISGR